MHFYRLIFGQTLLSQAVVPATKQTLLWYWSASKSHVILRLELIIQLKTLTMVVTADQGPSAQIVKN